MIGRRFKAAVRKYKLSGLAVFSFLGLGSAYAVNLAGFLVLLPRPMWGLVDANFATSYFLRFSAMLALAFLVSRFSGYLIASLLSSICFPVAVARLLFTKKGRRVFRIMGYRASVETGSMMILRHDAQVRDGNKLSKLEAVAKWSYQSGTARAVAALFGLSGYVRGGVDARVEHYLLPLQLLVALGVLSAIYTTVEGSLVLLGLAAFLVLVLPPTVGDVYFGKPFFQANVPFLSVLKFHSSKLFTVQKAILLALTISFTGGILHHTSLVEETSTLKFSGDVNVRGSLVLTSNSGFVIYNPDTGYMFVPIEGTQIEAEVKR